MRRKIDNCLKTESGLLLSRVLRDPPQKGGFFNGGGDFANKKPVLVKTRRHMPLLKPGFILGRGFGNY